MDVRNDPQAVADYLLTLMTVRRSDDSFDPALCRFLRLLGFVRIVPCIRNNNPRHTGETAVVTPLGVEAALDQAELLPKIPTPAEVQNLVGQKDASVAMETVRTAARMAGWAKAVTRADAWAVWLDGPEVPLVVNERDNLVSYFLAMFTQYPAVSCGTWGYQLLPQSSGVRVKKVTRDGVTFETETRSGKGGWESAPRVFTSNTATTTGGITPSITTSTSTTSNTGAVFMEWRHETKVVPTVCLWDDLYNDPKLPLYWRVIDKDYC